MGHNRAGYIEADKGDGGYAVVEFAILFGLILIVVFVGINLVAIWYVKGAVRASLDDGARYGALEGNSAGECLNRAQGSVNDLLGPARVDINISCQDNGVVVTASAVGSVPYWLNFGGPISNFDISHTALVVREPEVQVETGP